MSRNVWFIRSNSSAFRADRRNWARCGSHDPTAPLRSEEFQASVSSGCRLEPPDRGGIHQEVDQVRMAFSSARAASQPSPPTVDARQLGYRAWSAEHLIARKSAGGQAVGAVLLELIHMANFPLSSATGDCAETPVGSGLDGDMTTTPAIEPLELGPRVVSILQTGRRVVTYKLATLDALIGPAWRTVRMITIMRHRCPSHSMTLPIGLLRSIGGRCFRSRSRARSKH